MSLRDFITKQFIDVIEWVEPEEGLLAYRYPMQDREIQNGGKLTVRDSQAAVFVNEGKVADAFGPGRRIPFPSATRNSAPSVFAASAFIRIT